MLSVQFSFNPGLGLMFKDSKNVQNSNIDFHCLIRVNSINFLNVSQKCANVYQHQLIRLFQTTINASSLENNLDKLS